MKQIKLFKKSLSFISIFFCCCESIVYYFESIEFATLILVEMTCGGEWTKLLISVARLAFAKNLVLDSVYIDKFQESYVRRVISRSIYFVET